MRKAGLASFSFFCSDFREDEKKGLHEPISSLLLRLRHQSDSFCDILITFDLEHAKGLRFPSDGPGAIARRSNDLYPRPPTVYLIMGESSDASGIRSPLAKVLNFTISESAGTHHWPTGD
jgi:hypothetical protein